MKILKTLFIISIFCISFKVNSEDIKIDNDSNKLNFFTGMFDFSDEKKSAATFGIQHLNEELNRDTLIGNLSPVTGAMITADNASYLYTGVQANYTIGKLNFNPSFAPGYYNQGDGKDLGNALEFKSELQLSMDLPRNSSLGLSYNHLSNAGLGDKNPGANSYMFNFFQKF